MAARGRDVPGLGIAMMTVGGFLMYVGIRNIPIVDGLREITSGRLPTPRESQITSVNFTMPEFTVGGGGGPGQVNPEAPRGDVQT